MLEPWVIQKIRRREEEENRRRDEEDRPQIHLPLPLQPPPRDEPKDDESVVIIEIA